MQCSATAAVTPQLRAEGVTEEIGDIVLTCTGSTPNPVAGGLIPTANIVVSLGTQVTSRIIGSGNISEALLLIDEPGSGLTGAGPAAAQTVCSSATNGAGAGGCSNPGSGALGLYNGITGGTQGTPVVCSLTANNGQTCTTAVAGPASNVYQGIVANNQVTFFGVPILAPVSSGVTRIFRITNVRANVSSITGLGLAGITPLNASIAISGATSVPVTNPVLVTGFIQNGLAPSVRNAGNTGGLSSTSGPLAFLQCNSINTGSNGLTNNGQSATLRFAEAFGSAFKTRTMPTATTNGLNSTVLQNIPGAIYNSESNFIIPIQTNQTAQPGLSDFGTRLRAVFTNIPAGVNIFVSTTNLIPGGGTFGGNAGAGNTTLQPNATTLAFLVQSEIAPDFNNQAPLLNPTNTINGNFALFQVPLTAGANGNTGEAVWEVVAANPSTIENFDFGVWFQFSANPGAGSPALGSGKVNMSFAPAPGFGPPPNTPPTSSYLSASSGPIPRFVDNSTANTFITISTCATDLLFPFITNDNGFETGISIANTTKDSLGTSVQNGTCAMTLYAADPNNTAWNATATAANAIAAGANCSNAGICLFNTNTATGAKTIAGGNSYVNTLSAIFTGASPAIPTGSTFQGYAIAICNFQLAHGFAFITDTHATNLAMGYLALVISPASNNPRGVAAENLVH
jgi:hypothetical protein